MIVVTFMEIIHWIDREFLKGARGNALQSHHFISAQIVYLPWESLVDRMEMSLGII